MTQNNYITLRNEFLRYNFQIFSYHEEKKKMNKHGKKYLYYYGVISMKSNQSHCNRVRNKPR